MKAAPVIEPIIRLRERELVIEHGTQKDGRGEEEQWKIDRGYKIRQVTFVFVCTVYLYTTHQDVRCGYSTPQPGGIYVTTYVCTTNSAKRQKNSLISTLKHESLCFVSMCPTP